MPLSVADRYEYMADLCQLEAARPNNPVSVPQQLSEVTTPLGWQEWDWRLAAYPDQRLRSYLVQCIKEGFRMGFTGMVKGIGQCSVSNMPSTKERPKVIDDYLAEECSKGRVLGPLKQELFPQVHPNRFGVIPKGRSGRWRLIVDLSFPGGESVNDGIGGLVCSLSYVGIGEAVRGIVARGRGSQLAKVDIHSAYRNVPVHPEDRWLLGMVWRDALFVDVTLPFGLRSAPKIFTALADAAEWMVRREGVDFLIHYLDDFLLIGRPDSEECAGALTKLLEVFKQIGFPVAPEKLEGPTTRLVFLGFELDTLAMEVRLPQEKLAELKELAHQWVGRRSCSVKDLESLIGKLGHAAQVVVPGKTFLRWLFELKGKVGRASRMCRLNAGIKSNILWWATFLRGWNGVSMLRDQMREQSPNHVWTDASGSFGYGAWFPAAGQWLQLGWSELAQPSSLEAQNGGIAWMELLPIILACAMWGVNWAGGSVTFHCDNAAVVAVVNSGYSRAPEIMHLLRCMFFIRARIQLDVWAVHTPGAQNGIADAISRNNLHRFFLQVPEAQARRVMVPRALRELLIEQQPDWMSAAWAQSFGDCFQLA